MAATDEAIFLAPQGITTASRRALALQQDEPILPSAATAALQYWNYLTTLADAGYTGAIEYRPDGVFANGFD